MNKIKEPTYKAIEDLKYAGIKCIMATGDHGLTAIPVAKKCKIIDEHKPVYFGDLESNGDTKFIKWQLMKHHIETSEEKKQEKDDFEDESANYKSVDAKDPEAL